MAERRARTTLAERSTPVAVSPDTAVATSEPLADGAGQPATESVHPAMDSTGVSSATGVARVGYAPIVRVDTGKREVELCATSEAIDSYGTVFDYEASKDAFSRWIGNVREMHERRAVGQRVAIRCDDDTRRVHVTVRISLGTRDTWEKVLDGTLRGASIGASNVIWQRQTRLVGGKPHSTTKNRTTLPTNEPSRRRRLPRRSAEVLTRSLAPGERRY